MYFNLVVLACVLRRTTKKVVNFFEGGGEKSAPPEKIFAATRIGHMLNCMSIGP